MKNVGATHEAEQGAASYKSRLTQDNESAISRVNGFFAQAPTSP